MSDGATTFGPENAHAPSGCGEFSAWRASPRLAGGRKSRSLGSRLRRGSYPGAEFDTHRDLNSFFNSLLEIKLHRAFDRESAAEERRAA